MSNKPQHKTVKELLINAAKNLRHEFEEIKSNNPHYGERGEEAENIVKDFLNSHLPKRFHADTGFVIDHDDNQSDQTDVIVYDADNSPIYRTGSKSLIVTSDNVAAAIEVKTNLNKKELEDSARKIASVKRLKRSPITDVDQPVTFSPLINTKSYGVVFAYESETSLETLAENLKEINRKYPSDQWIDLIVVLDKGVVGYTIQMPFDQDFPGWLGGPMDDEFPPPPYYIHLVKAELGELTLNKFFVNLIAHLTFYRKRAIVDFNNVLGAESKQVMTLNAYQYNLARELKDVTDDHRKENFTMPLRYNIFRVENGESKEFMGQVCRKPWQDGAILTYSGHIHPELIFKPFFQKSKTSASYMQAIKGEKLWVTSVMPLTEEDFSEVCEKIQGDIKAIKDKDEDRGITGLPQKPSK